MDDEIKIVITGQDKATTALDKQIKNLQNLSSQIEQINQAFKRASSTKGLDNFSMALERVGNAAAGFTRFASAINRSKPENFSNFAEGIRLITHELEALEKIDAGKLESLANIARGLKSVGTTTRRQVEPTTEKDLGDTSAESRELDSVGNSASVASGGLNAFRIAMNGVKDASRSLWSGTKRVASGIFSISLSAAKATTPLYGLVRGLRSASSRLRQISSDIMRIAKYRIIRSVIRAITQGFSEGIKNAYEFAKATNNAFASSMDSLATSSQYLKNSLGALAMPLVNIVAPAIDMIVDKFVAMLNVINRVFAMLSGASTWTKAIKYPKSFGDAMQGAAGSAKKAAKDIKATILGIDEINPLNDQNDPSSGGGGGGGGAAEDYASMFETVPLEQSEFVKNLKDIFEPFKKAWENEGQATIESIDYAFKSIKSLIGTIGSDFKDMWTGGTGQSIIESYLRTFQNINKTIGNIANNIKLAWEEGGKGKRIVEELGGLWEDVAKFIEGISKSTEEWSQDLDFGPMIDSIGDLAEGFRKFAKVLEEKFKWVWDNILLPFGEWAIEEGLPSVISALGHAFEVAGKLIEKAWPLIEPALSFLKDMAIDSFEKFVDAFNEFVDAIDSLSSLDLKGTFEHLTKGLGDLVTNPLILLLLGKSAGKGLLSYLGGAAATGGAATTGGATGGAAAGAAGGSLLGLGALAAGHFASTNLLPWLLAQSTGEAATKAAIELEVTGANNTSKSMLEFFASKKPKKDVTVNGKGKEDDALKGIRQFFGVESKTIELGYEMDGTQNKWDIKQWLNTKTKSFFNWLGYKQDGTEKQGFFTTWRTIIGRTIKNILGYNSDGSENNSNTKTWRNIVGRVLSNTLGYKMDGSQGNSNVKNWQGTTSSKSTFWKILGFKTDGSEGNSAVKNWFNASSSSVYKSLQMNLRLKVESIVAGKSASSGNTHAVSIIDQRFTYAQGGFPASGSVFVANENGPEYVGKFGSGTAVANNDQIVEGISQGVANANMEQNRLLREQNELLRALLEKDNGGNATSSSDVLRALSQMNRRTGRPVVSMN